MNIKKNILSFFILLSTMVFGQDMIADSLEVNTIDRLVNEIKNDSSLKTINLDDVKLLNRFNKKIYHSLSVQLKNDKIVCIDLFDSSEVTGANDLITKSIRTKYFINNENDLIYAEEYYGGVQQRLYYKNEKVINIVRNQPAINDGKVATGKDYILNNDFLIDYYIKTKIRYIKILKKHTKYQKEKSRNYKMSNYKNIFFLGIGGIGMSAIARYFKRIGKNVAGYDKTPTQLTHELEAEGIAIHYTDDLENITADYQNTEDTLVVYTPAVPKHHTELNYFQNNGFAVKKRAEVLGIITQNSFSLAVAGTHGKTTTSSMLAHILVDANAPVTAFLGGVVEGYDTNLIGNGTDATVVEADEFDRSFLHLHPNIACVISDDADHLDIYGTNDAIKSSFAEFASKISDKDKLFIAQGIENINGTEVSVNGTAVINAYNLRFENGKRVFDLDFKGEKITDIKLLMPGEHNVMNASLAFAMAKTYGLSNDEIKSGLDSFKGIRRRFSYKINTEKLVMIDDYAHHPTEIKAVSQAVHEMYPNKKITAVFQPHLFSRTRDFMDGFAESLSTFNNVILLEIYPARELPIENINSEVLINKIKSASKILLPKEELVSFLTENTPEVLLIIGAGDVGEMVDEIKTELEKNN